LLRQLIDWETGIGNELAPWAERHGLTVSATALIETFASFETVVQSEFPTMLFPRVLATVLRMSAHYGIVTTDGEARDFGDSAPRWRRKTVLARLGEADILGGNHEVELDPRGASRWRRTKPDRRWRGWQA